MRMRGRKRKGQLENRKLYIGLILSYLAVFLIPLILNIKGLEEIGRSTRDSISQNMLSNLEHARDTVEKNISELDSVVEKLSNNSTIRYVATQMNEENKYIEISKLLAARTYMSTLQPETFADEYYLFFRDNDIVLSSDRIFQDGDRAAGFFQYDGMSWEQWKAKIFRPYSAAFFPAAMTKQNILTQEKLLYVQSLVTLTGVKGTFVFPIRKESIANLLADTYVSKEGWGYVTDEAGTVLLTIPSETGSFSLIPKEYLKNGQSIQNIRLEGEAVEVMQAVSDKTGLVFVVVLPQKYIAVQIAGAQTATFRMMIFAVIVGGAAILAVSWSRGRKIGSIIRENQDLTESIREKEVITRGLLLEGLLYGTESHAEKELQAYGVDLEGRKVRLLLYQFASWDREKTGVMAAKIPVLKQRLQEMVNQMLRQENYTCDLSVDAGAFLCTVDGRENRMATGTRTNAEVEEMLQQAAEAFRRETGVRLRLAISEVCEDLGQISRAYDQLWEMLQYGPASDRDVLLENHYRGDEAYYYFPVSLEERLVNSVRSGNAESLHDQLREVYQVNVMERNTSPEMMHFLVNDLQCTIFRIIHGLEDNMDVGKGAIVPQLEALNKETDILVRLNHINSIFRYICEHVQAENTADVQRQAEKIRNYIARNYSSSALSLTKIADDFGYSSTYFSKLFKELFGENFAAYLESVRIEEVCRLLRTQDTMEKIAGKTGYNSVYVMRTAFKRVKGITPNEYRKLQEGKEKNNA